MRWWKRRTARRRWNGCAAPVHLILTDLNMPRMDGIELVKRVRADPMHKYVPIVLLTTESQDAKKQAGRAAGATGWIVKPFQAEQLLGGSEEGAGMTDQEAYREEARELLAELESSLLELEQTPEDQELIGRVFRALHTIKGSGAMFGFDLIAAFTHNVENAFDLVRSRTVWR